MKRDLFTLPLGLRDESGRFVAGRSYSPSTQFKPGARAAIDTEFKPGERPSIATEFRAGQAAHNRLPVGSVKVRRETHTGLFRAWVKTTEPNVWQKRAVVVWISENGPVPKGKVIHHRDRDSLNDDPSNLEALTKSEHAEEHRSELLAWRHSEDALNFGHENEYARVA